MKIIGVLLVGASLLASAPALACNDPLAGATPVAAPSAEIGQLSQRFAQLYMPQQTAIDNALRLGAAEFRRGVEMGEGGADLIANQPELYQHLESAAVTALQQCLEQRLPDVHILLANLASARLSAVDLRRINAFYMSDGGQALMREVATSATPPADLVDAEGNVRTVTTQDLQQMVRSTPLSGLTQQQRLSIALFERTTAGARLNAVAPQLVEIVVAGINGINAQSTPFVERAVIDALDEWTARTPPAGKAQGRAKQ
jgi:hypothetical protein